MDDTFLFTVDADVVEFGRLSQAVRLEREQATSYFSVCDYEGNERGIFYAFEAAKRFCDKHEFAGIDYKPILREMP